MTKKIHAQFAIIAVLFVFMYLFTLGPLTIAQMKEDANDSIVLDVNISVLAAIEVLPTAIAWVQIIPGSNGTAGNLEDIRNVTLKNVGSFNLTSFYIDINTEDIELNNPVAGGQITDYAAGGFVMFRNESVINYYHAGRMEWNLSEVMAQEYLNQTAGAVNYSHGWYRPGMNSCGDWRTAHAADQIPMHSATAQTRPLLSRTSPKTQADTAGT
jgi:hypothetical protein